MDKSDKEVEVAFLGECEYLYLTLSTMSATMTCPAH